MQITQKITPCLWFDGTAEDAARFYANVFEDADVVSTTPGPDGKPLVVTFKLAGQQFIALNGGPQFKFNEAVSLSIDCADQAEVDRMWDRLTAEGGQPGPCGWIKDKFGLSWQIVPQRLPELLADPDRDKAGRVMSAMMQMTKIDIARLEEAASATAVTQ